MNTNVAGQGGCPTWALQIAHGATVPLWPRVTHSQVPSASCHTVFSWMTSSATSLCISEPNREELWKQFPGCVIADQLSQLPLETCSVSYLIIVRRPFILRSLCTEPFHVDSLLFVASNWLWCPPSLYATEYSPPLFSPWISICLKKYI